MNVSVLFGKKVISTSGKSGYIISVNGGLGRVECLVCADNDENEFIVDIKNVVSFGEKVIFEDRENAIKAACPLSLGRAGFDEKGKYLGEVCDYTFNGNKLLRAKIGKKTYPAGDVVCGDAVIVKQRKRLKQDVVKDGKIIFKKGTPVTEEMLASAERQGEYVQTNLKSL